MRKGRMPRKRALDCIVLVSSNHNWTRVHFVTN